MFDSEFLIGGKLLNLAGSDRFGAVLSSLLQVMEAGISLEESMKSCLSQDYKKGLQKWNWDN